MKRPFGYIVILCCLLSTYALAQRELPRPSPWRLFAQPTTLNLSRLSFLDTERGWIAGDSGLIMNTTDGGKIWATQRRDSVSQIMDLQMLNARFGWAVAWIFFTDTANYYGSEVLKTTNGGATWTGSRFTENDRYYHTVFFLDSLVGFLGGIQGDIQRTTDGGRSWRRAQVDSSVGAGFTIHNIQFATPTLGFASGGQIEMAGVIWRTTNGGLNWQADIVAPEPIYEFHFVDLQHIVAICGDYDYGMSMLRSRDGGLRWEYIYLNIFGMPRAIAARTPSEYWVPAGNLISVTPDTANHWFTVDTLGWRTLYDMKFVDANVGYAVADSGFVYKYDRRRNPPVKHHDELRSNVSALKENYPNPFNPTTTIRFAVGESATPQNVLLEIYDVLGRRVASLVNEKKVAGEYSIVWDASLMASGMYLVRFNVGAVVQNRKILLLR